MQRTGGEKSVVQNKALNSYYNEHGLKLFNILADLSSFDKDNCTISITI